MKPASVWLLLGLLVTSAAFAIDPIVFPQPEQELRFQSLTQELRCLVCQNQNLADSDAPLAQDLRREVAEMVRAGQSDAEIKQFLVARYGDFVLYRPPFKPITWALWIGPPIILLIAFLLARGMWRRPAVADKSTADETTPNTAEDGREFP